MATLLIGGSSSDCSSCGMGASPREHGHYRRLGYGVEPGTPGCGEPWDRAIYITHYGFKYTAENVARDWFSDHVNELLIAEYTTED